MFQIFRRIGVFRRRWIWALLMLAALGFAGYWAVPWRGAGPELQLVAMRPDGTFAQTLQGIPVTAGSRDGVASSTRADSLPEPEQPIAATSRRGIPLVLGIANSGMREGRPERLVLSLPRWYRLIDPGPYVRQELSADEPLQQYVIETQFPIVEAGRVPTLMPGIDTLWLEPWVPDYYCTAGADSLPNFIASTPPDTAGIVELSIFYSFDGADLEGRHTGLLTVELPGEMFRRSGRVDFTESPVQMQQPRAERPAMGALINGGSREAECGPPGDPMRIFSVLWLSADSGRMISVHYGGSQRKEYYDLNRDSILELEMWDPDGDGEMEAWRRLSLPIPEYMLPVPPPPPPPLLGMAADSLAADSLGADSAAFDSLAGAAPTTATTGGTPLPIDSDIASLGRLLIPGDLATARRLFVRRAPLVRPQPDDGLLGQPLGEPGDLTGAPDDEPAVEAEPDPPPARPARRRNVPLGEPVDR